MRAPAPLHALLDEVPEQEWHAVQRYLEFLKAQTSASVVETLSEEETQLLNQALNEADRGETIEGEAFFSALRQQVEASHPR